MKIIREADVRCPFYQSHRMKYDTLFCEGMTPDTTTGQMFGSDKAFISHLEKYCAGHYEDCPWAAMLTGLYEK